METKDITVREFIKNYLIVQIGEIKNNHPYFAFLLMAVGIEFLGKCQNSYDWDDSKEKIKPYENFENGLQLGPLKKYANIKGLYDKLRNGLAHALLIKQGIKVSQGDSPNALNSDTFYADFKEACESVLNAKDNGCGKIMTADSIEIKKDLDATFFTITGGTNQTDELFSMTAITQSNSARQTNNKS
nr:hypothetical protein [Bacteroidales bacterium]